MRSCRGDFFYFFSGVHAIVFFFLQLGNEKLLGRNSLPSHTNTQTHDFYFAAEYLVITPSSLPPLLFLLLLLHTLMVFLRRRDGELWREGTLWTHTHRSSTFLNSLHVPGNPVLSLSPSVSLSSLRIVLRCVSLCSSYDAAMQSCGSVEGLSPAFFLLLEKRNQECKRDPPPHRRSLTVAVSSSKRESVPCFFFSVFLSLD